MALFDLPLDEFERWPKPGSRRHSPLR